MTFTVQQLQSMNKILTSILKELHQMLQALHRSHTRCLGYDFRALAFRTLLHTSLRTELL
jgi:hypothetical protein